MEVKSSIWGIEFGLSGWGGFFPFLPNHFILFSSLKAHLFKPRHLQLAELLAPPRVYTKSIPLYELNESVLRSRGFP